jgi:hypothetical protein
MNVVGAGFTQVKLSSRRHTHTKGGLSYIIVVIIFTHLQTDNNVA